jgi:hypothetical protein
VLFTNTAALILMKDYEVLDSTTGTH